MNTDYHPPNANKHVETTWEPEGARSKRRRGSDGAAVDGDAAMLASQPTGLKRTTLGAGVLELAAPSTGTPSTGKGRPVPGSRVLGTSAPSAGKEELAC